MVHSAFKLSSWVLAVGLLGSCGGGGGGGTAPEPEAVVTGVSTSFDFNWEATSGGDAGVGGGADGDGGVGGGGDFGQFRNALVIVRLKDGSLLGSAKTDVNNGMVTIRPGRSYQGPLYLELRGSTDATYYEEGKNAYVPFPEGAVVRAIVPKIDKNIGVTIITDAAYRLLTEGAAPVSGIAAATPAQITAANNTVRDIVNQQFPKALEVSDITRLPFIKSATVGKALPVNSTSPEGRRGVYGLVSGAFSKQAAMFNANDAAPTLSALKQLGEDLIDGKLDGMKGATAAVAADKRTYDPQTVAGELSAALAQQSFRFGDTSAEQALPPVTNFGNVRYEGYLFDASLNNKGEAFSTVAGWVATNEPGDSLGGPQIGTARKKLTPAARVFGVFGNFGHGSMFLKTDAENSASAVYAVGDNTNGELGVGDRSATVGRAVPLALPGILTHVAGGQGHTVARLADGSVYTWGDNLYGQLGQGVDWTALSGSTTPLRVTLPAGAVAVAASNTASYALFADGTVQSWGSSWGFGLLGDGNKDGVRTSPAPVMSPTGPLADVVQIAARDNDVVVLKRDGSLWTWGAHPSDNSAFVPGDPSAPYAGGSLLPTQITGLPAGTQVRKILTEQGLFAALTTEGHVYTWGVHFDITAATILRVLSAQRVLGLPPVRDLMPGGYIGYGVRPFDRLTAMAIDYRGNMWKVRGLVAEQFDPANPTQQRRPLHAVSATPFPPCAECHLFLTDWPLTPPAPTSGAVCVPPSNFHSSGTESLIHSDTPCQQCHNPARTVLRPSFTGGWLNCERPTNLPVRAAPVPPPTPPVGTPECQVPPGHAFTPPGTVCASCHNSIIATPLQSLVPACVTPNPNSTQLPTLPTKATITAALNGGTPISAGATVASTTPTLQGSISAALLSGQTVRVLRNGAVLTPGAATMTGASTWSFTDPSAPNGAVTYTARVEAGAAFGARSNAFTFTVDTLASAVAANVTGASGDSGPISNTGFTTDTTPTVTGTLSGALVAGDVVRVLRNGTQAGAGTVSGLNWTYTEPSALALGDYTYTALVVDAAGNLGAVAAGWTVRITSLPTVAITRLLDNPGGSVLGAVTADATPRVEGTINQALASGQVVRVLRNGAPLATVATVSGTAWFLNDSIPTPVSGTQTYTAQAEAGSLLGVQSTGVSVLVDTVAPALANVTGVFDEFVGAVPNGGSTTDSTPQISGTLTAQLNAVAGASTETLQVLRNGVVLAATPTITYPNWSVTDSPMTAGTPYTYSARVVDAAGNQSPAGATWAATYDATTRTASITGAFNGSTPIGAATSDTTPEVRGSVNATLLPGQWVRVLRGGVAISGQITPSSGAWSFTDSLGASVSQGVSYTARVESASSTGTQSPPLAFTVDNVVPNHTITVSVISGGNTVTTNQRIQDISPTIRIVLSRALDANAGTLESLVITRALTPSGFGTTTTTLSPALTSCAATPPAVCFQFVDTSAVAFSAPNTASAMPTQAQYTVAVRDLAQNSSAAAPSPSFRFDYLDCVQPVVAHATISFSANPAQNCYGCHSAVAGTNPTPAAALVVVPPPAVVRTKYWCRRPP